MTRALLIVPPYIGVAYGPLLGPAMLVAAGRAAGHEIEVLDLNARWIREHAAGGLFEPRRFIGDHDRPRALAEMRQRFKADLGLAYRARTHEQLRAGVFEIEREALGQWAASYLARTTTTPAVVGVSVMYGDQVAPALAITAIARRRFPEATIIWGGAHVTAMREEIARDEAYGWLIDGFVVGYAEVTWVDLLAAVGRGDDSLPAEIVRAGEGRIVFAREDLEVVPDFGDLSAYAPERLTLPLQASRGCSYGKCGFCTYPAIEGGRARRCAHHAVQLVIEQATALGASLSFKDSLVDPDLLLDLAERIGGRVSWSACTKLQAGLPTILARLAGGGCRTLEIGLETIDPQAQRDALKKQKIETLLGLLDAAREFGVALVINYITGFPNADREREEACKRFVQEQLTERSGLVAKLEHHELEVERLAPFGRAPAAHNIEIVGDRVWSSVLEWRRGPKR